MIKKPNLFDKLLHVAIYFLPFTALAFYQEGYGLIQLSLPIILLILMLFTLSPKHQHKLVLGNKISGLSIIFFLVITTTSTIFILLINQDYSLYKSTGVLASLIIFFFTYYTVSAVNTNIYKSFSFFKSFIRVALFVAFLVIIEFTIKNICGRNYIYEFMNYICSLLPYPTQIFSDDSLLNRYKGILVEPGDVGLFTMPAFASFVSVLFIDKKKVIINLFYILLLAYATYLSGSVTNYLLLLLIAGLSLKMRKIEPENISWVKMIFIVLITIVSIFLGIFIFIQFQAHIHPAIRDRLVSLAKFVDTQDYDNNSNLSVQVILNSYYATMLSLQKNFLFGIGLGNFSQSYQTVAIAKGIITRLNQHDGYSMLLRLLSEVGVIGTLTFLYIFWTRIAQSIELLAYIKKYFAYLLSPEKHDEIHKGLLMINSAAIASLVYAFANRPTYWNLVIPLLYGLCFKINYINATGKNITP